MASDHIQVIKQGGLYALQNVFKLDGLASSYPKNAQGYSVVNSYILKNASGALMLDSGYSAHLPAILKQLHSVLDVSKPLSIYPLRLNEFMSVSNVEAIAEEFIVDQCYSSNPDAALWVDFGGRSDSLNPKPLSIKTSVVTRAQTIYLGGDESYPLEAFQAPIRLIATRWIYDKITRTLFTSDSFTHEWSSHEDGPWVYGDSDDATSVEHIKSFLLNTRYWWLEGGETTSLRKKLAGVFEKYDIENIAPGYGRVLCGKKLVERQYRLLDEALRQLDKSQVEARYVFRDEVR
jgi:hypothetical protein